MIVKKTIVVLSYGSTHRRVEKEF